jgi:hypothetical protein
MRFMMLVKGSAARGSGALPDEPLLAAMAAYREELARAGVLLDAAGLTPSAQGWRLRWLDGQPRAIEGPSGAGEDLVAGYTLIDVRSGAEALAWARRFPMPQAAGVASEIELRPLYQPELEQG